MGTEELQQAAALAALATAFVRITRRRLVEIGSEIATAETPQRMLTPQDRQKKLLVVAAERVQGPTFTPREGGAVTMPRAHDGPGKRHR